MKILIYTDNHFCERYSIVSKFGKKYTVRLENQLASLDWVERLAEARSCGLIVCAGDFFDKSSLSQDELTALRDVKWSRIKHYFLVGNHESEEADLRYSSTKALESEDRIVVSDPDVIDFGAFELAFLPYTPESQRKPIGEYFGARSKPRLLISHNDLLGVQMGPAVSSVGFTPDELGSVCDLCVNGHLHNGQWITDKVLNLGNLTGKDFGEDAGRYPHRALIVDTDGMKTEFVENPHALNFYKVNVDEEADFAALAKLKPNAVVSLQCPIKLLADAKSKLEGNANVICCRVIAKQDAANDVDIADIAELAVDHCAKFAECCRAKFEASPILEAELAEILK